MDVISSQQLPQSLALAVAATTAAAPHTASLIPPPTPHLPAFIFPSMLICASLLQMNDWHLISRFVQGMAPQQVVETLQLIFRVGLSIVGTFCASNTV